MKKEMLERIFKYEAFIELDGYILFDDLELYNTKTKKARQFPNAQEALDFKIDKNTISEHLDKITFEFINKGGRGYDGEMGGGFNHASQGEGGAGRNLFPAEFNRQGRFTSQDRAIKYFAQKYADADIEYGISVDKDGFVHAHRQGSKTAVAISARGKDHMVVHNHPNDSSFSDTDLLNVARDKSSSGIIALGKSHVHTIRKQKGFNPKSWTKAVRGAQWPRRMNYNDGADWWLRRNAKKYGLKYSRTKTVEGGLR